MEKPPLLVSQFDKTLISLLIRESFGAEFPDITQKTQIQYLYNYLENLGAKTVVCETSYTDKDYLMDYQEYYVRCFHGYSNKCARLHFFSEEFSYRELKDGIDNPNPEVGKYQDSYLGFSVIKPLPVTFLGRTCLKHYEVTGEEKRKYISREYKAHLLGIELTVNSIAYQEQDKVVSACATTALWSLMHATSHLSVSDIPSPSEITLNAISNDSSNINGFPNKGLSDSEVIKTLELSKLKMHQFKVDNEDGITISDLNTHIKEHVDSNIPIFAGVSVYTKPGKDRRYKFEGDHAVTVLGYKEGNDGEICSLYLHDDRIGPYARAIKKSKKVKIEFKKNGKVKTSNIRDYYSLEVDKLNNDKKEIFILRNLKTATYYKVRIPYSLILSACKDLQNSMNLAMSGYEVSYTAGFTIKLLDSNEAKKTYLKESNISDKSTVLIKNWPRYIWKCSFNVGNAQLFDLIYDATDIPLGNGLIHVIEKNSASTQPVLKMLKELYESEPRQSRDPSKIELSFFYSTMRKICSKKVDSFETNLGNLFGPLHPPKMIKPEEVYKGDIANNLAVDEYFLSTTGRDLDLFFKKDEESAIWVITDYGTIMIGPDKGHPTLVKAKPARVAGEIHKLDDGTYRIDDKSNRYSSQQSKTEKVIYFRNALEKFRGTFYKETINLAFYEHSTTIWHIDDKTYIDPSK